MQKGEENAKLSSEKVAQSQGGGSNEPFLGITEPRQQVMRRLERGGEASLRQALKDRGKRVDVTVKTAAFQSVASGITGVLLTYRFPGPPPDLLNLNIWCMWPRNLHLTTSFSQVILLHVQV